MKLVSIFVAFSFCISGLLFAGGIGDDGILFSERGLSKHSFSCGQSSFELYAPGIANISSLVKEINFSKGESPDSIYEKVNRRRLQFYPDQEMILMISASQPLAKHPQDARGLVRSIYWWNNYNCRNCYWMAQYNSTIATMFVDDVQYGAYRIYDRVGGENWRYRYRISEGQSGTRCSWGGFTLRGFKGESAGLNSKADIVMYFFN